jgi:hypothetical protein
MRNQASGQQEVARGRNVIAGFVPEVRQAQQGRVQRQERGKNQDEHQRGMRSARRLGIRYQDLSKLELLQLAIR